MELKLKNLLNYNPWLITAHRERERERSREGGDKVQQERKIMPLAATGSSMVKASTSALTRVFVVSPTLTKFLGIT
jgi:hypothetical protein